MMSNAGETPSWVIAVAVVALVLLLGGFWYRFLGPGSAPPPPTRVEAPDDGGLSPKARTLYYGAR
jgi:hypothetical protein